MEWIGKKELNQLDDLIDTEEKHERRKEKGKEQQGEGKKL